MQYFDLSIFIMSEFKVANTPCLMLQKCAETLILCLLIFRDAQGNTALHLATVHNRCSNVNALLRMGADASLVNVYGYTPLILSAQFGYEEITKILLNPHQGKQNLKSCIQSVLRLKGLSQHEPKSHKNVKSD